MKKILMVTALFALMTNFEASAQHDINRDWANFGRYAEANSQVEHKPTAVFMGDSITDLWDNQDPAFFKDNDILCRGISGQTTSQMLVRFRQDVVELHPKYVLIMAGTNDIARNTGFIELKNIVGNIKSMCELARANKIKPIIISITPANQYPWRQQIKDVDSNIIWTNQMLKEYAKKARIPYVDLHSVMKDEENGLPATLSKDGVHPNKEGYKVMAPIILEALKK